MATHSSVLALRIPGTGEPGGLPSMGSHRVGHNWSDLAAAKLLNSPSYLNEILAGYSSLGYRFFSFITLSMSCHSLLAWRVSIDRSAVILMGIPCVLFVVSPLLLLIFVLCVWSLLIWLICVLGCFTLGLSCLGLSVFLRLGWLFPSPF